MKQLYMCEMCELTDIKIKNELYTCNKCGHNGHVNNCELVEDV